MDLAFGVDLGGTNVRAAAVDVATGAVVASHKERHGADRSAQAVAESAARAVRAAARAAGVPAPGRVGVGLAGQCMGSTGVVLNAPNLGWRDAPFGQLLAKALDARVRVANDLAAAAVGEHRFGAARGAEDVVLFFVGSGIGGGLIFRGEPFDGAGGVAGEVGHTKVRVRPGTAERRCGCGQVGCLEAYGGGMNIAARVREELSAGKGSRILDLVGGDLTKVGPAQVEEAAAQGDAYATGLQEEIAELLGDGCANLCTILNPARLILGGGVLLGSPRLEQLVRARLDARVSVSAARGLQIVKASLGDDAGVIGAAFLAPQ